MQRNLNLICKKCENVLRDQSIGNKIPRCKKTRTVEVENVFSRRKLVKCGGKNEILWDSGGPAFNMLRTGYAGKKGR